MHKNKRIRAHENIRNLCTFALMTCVLFLTGCEQQHEVVTEQIFLPDIGNDKVMEIAEDVLTEMHFTIEKADVESGFIKTRPLSGAQFFEFWRSDNVGVENSLQANLHTIRRTVELDLSPRGEQLCITCNVQVQRLSLPERDVSSSARAYEMFSTSSSSLQTLTLGPEQKKNIAWVDLDKDMQLATEILKRIEKRIVHRTNNEQQTMGNET